MAAEPRDDFTFTPLIVSFVGPDVSDWKASRWSLSELSQLTKQTESSLLPSWTDISSVALPALKLAISGSHFYPLLRSLAL